MAIQRFELELLNAEMISSNVKHLEFKRVDDKDIDFIAGQFITFIFEHADGKPRKRSYSIASFPEETKKVQIAISYIKGGIASEHLCNMQVGETCNAMGPIGRLTLKNEPQIKRFILIGTGTGISPYRSMLPSLKEKMDASNYRVVILEGIQYRKDILYANDFCQYAKENKNLTFTACLSREKGKLGLFEQKGYVQEQFANLNLDPNKDVVYLCGNPNMIDDAYTALKELGFTTQNVSREKYIPSI